MATIQTSAVTHQHFTASSGDTVNFARTITHLIINIAVSTLTVSFDGGQKFMGLSVGTFQLNNIHVNQLVFAGTGSATGVGTAL